MNALAKAADNNFIKAVAIKRYVKGEKFKDTYKSLDICDQNVVSKAVESNDLESVVKMLDNTKVLKHMAILDLFDICDGLGIKAIRKKPKAVIVKLIETRRKS